MKIDIDNIKIKIKVIDTPKLRAIVGLEFEDFVIKGFRIQLSQHKDGLWLTPPSYRDGGGKYHPIFFVPNVETWKQLEEKILRSYELESKNYFKKRLDITDEDMEFLN